MTISTGLQETPTDDGAARQQEGLVDFRPPFVADAKSAKLMQPGDGALDDPAALYAVMAS